MSKSIIPEIRRNTRLSTDLDNFRSRYLDKDYYNDLTVKFPSGEIYTYEKNLYILISQSSLVDFKSSWSMRPDYTSYDMYDTEIYWPLILFVNRIYCIEEFDNLDKVLIPPLSVVLRLSQDKMPVGKDIKLKSTPIYSYGIFGKADSSSTRIDPLGISNADIGSEAGVRSSLPAKVFLQAPLDEMARKRKAAKDALVVSPIEVTPADISGTLYEKTETFTLSLSDILNKYVKLSYKPVNLSSLNVKLSDLDIEQKYGYDYVYKRMSNNDNIISWADDDCTFGIGMENALQTGDILSISYVHGTGRLASICYPEQTSRSTSTANFFPDLLDDPVLAYMGIESIIIKAFFMMFKDHILLRDEGFYIEDLFNTFPSSLYPSYELNDMEWGRFGSYWAFLLTDTDGDGYIDEDDFETIIDAAEERGFDIPTINEMIACWFLQTDTGSIIKNGYFDFTRSTAASGWDANGNIYAWNKSNVGTGYTELNGENLLMVTGDDPDIQIYQDSNVVWGETYNLRICYWGDPADPPYVYVYDITSGSPTYITGGALPAPEFGRIENFNYTFSVPSTCNTIRYVVKGGRTVGTKTYFDQATISGQRPSLFDIIDSDENNMISSSDVCTITSSMVTLDINVIGYVYLPLIAYLSQNKDSDTIENFSLTSDVIDLFDYNNDGYINKSDLITLATSAIDKLLVISDAVEIYLQTLMTVEYDLDPQYAITYTSGSQLYFSWDDGIAPFTIKWYKDNVLVTSGSGIIISNGDESTSIQFSSAQYSDEGVYYCTVEDSTGDSLTSIKTYLKVLPI